MASITNTSQIFSRSELPSPRPSVSTSISWNRIPILNWKKSIFSFKNIATGCGAISLAHALDKGHNSKMSSGGGNGGGGTNVGFGGDGGGGGGGTTVGLRPIIPEEQISNSPYPEIQSDTRWDKKNGGVTYVHQSDDVKTECSIFTNPGGPLTLALLEPRGTMSFELCNIQGNASIIGSVASNRLLHPQDDMNCNIRYVKPCIGGNTLCSSAYNVRKLSPALPYPTWVDKVGFEANITENYTSQTKFTYGLVLEAITVLSGGTPITPSGGSQRLYGRMTFVRDNTKFVNGAIVGDKIKFEIDQSPGLCERFPHFNRHQLKVTRFHPLKETEEGVGKPSPPVLVLHAHYGGYAGDLHPHDTFTLGGPDSVRGYKVGEIGAAINFLEVAAEVRVPVRNHQVYAFLEHGNDFGSSKGNPTKGHGSSYGVGAKVGFLGLEYAVNHNSHKGDFFVRFGERF